MAAAHNKASILDRAKESLQRNLAAAEYAAELGLSAD